jgi:hypothetical protein
MNRLTRPRREYRAGPPVSTRIVDALLGMGIVLFALVGWERGFRAVINACGIEHRPCGYP